MKGYASIRRDGWNGWCLSGMEETLLPVEKLFDNGECKVTNDVREVRRITLSTGEVCYLKRYFTVRAGQKIGERIRESLKFLLRGGRSEHVLKITNEMREDGFGCPETLLAMSRIDKGIIEEVTVIREIAEPTCKVILKDGLMPGENVLAGIASGLRLFHSYGYSHGDCLPGNLCMNKDYGISFIDNDRTSKSRWFMKSRIERNLLQFCSHHWLAPEDEEKCRAFLVKYFEDKNADAVNRIADKWRTRIVQVNIEIAQRLARQAGKV